MAKKTYNGVEYDDELDYSVEIEKAKIAGLDTTGLMEARQAKIDDKYKGEEPTLYGSDLKYSQLANDSQSTWRNTSGGGAASTYSPYAGSKWDSVLDGLAERLLSMNYTDWTQGNQYKALADRYAQQGQNAMQDVLGQISSRTGGLASSYATTAAQQQYNNYMQDLEAVAREMYGAERGELLENAQMAQSLSQEDYSRYLDGLSQFNNDRSFAYNADRDRVADKQYAENLIYQKAQDGIANELNQARFDHEKAQDSIANKQYEDETEYERQLALAKLQAELLGDTSWLESLQAEYGDLVDASMPAEDEDSVKDNAETSLPASGNGNYGASYSSIWSRARTMYDSGAGEDKIVDYLNRFSETQLTEAGLDYILRKLNIGGYRDKEA